MCSDSLFSHQRTCSKVVPLVTAALRVVASITQEGGRPSHGGSASAGLQKWRKNLQLLVPFLTKPKIDLLSLSELSVPETGTDTARRLQVCSCLYRDRWTLLFTNVGLVRRCSGTSYLADHNIYKLLDLSCCKPSHAEFKSCTRETHEMDMHPSSIHLHEPVAASKLCGSRTLA